MKKTLLVAASLAALAIPTMAADNVYSVNVVGYVNLPLHEGGNLVANPLDLDGSGTNNTISGVFSSNLPLNTQIYTWNPSSGLYSAAYSYTKNRSGVGTWSSGSDTARINPGQALWIIIQAGALGGATVTQQVATVGTVLQGTNMVHPYMRTLAPGTSGFSLISSMVPLSGGLQTTLQYTPQVGDVVYTHNGKTYNSVISYIKNRSGVGTWSPSEPQITPGQSFWLSTTNWNKWTNNFTVQ